MKPVVTTYAVRMAFRAVPNRSRKDAREILRECADDYIQEVIREAHHIAGPRRVITKLVIRKAISAIDQARAYGLEIDMRDPGPVEDENGSGRYIRGGERV